MAAEIYKCRVFQVESLERKENKGTRYVESWNGRDNDELCGYTTTKKTIWEAHHMISVKEINLTPFKEQIENRKRELMAIVKANPELYIGRVVAKIPQDNLQFVKEEEEEYEEPQKLDRILVFVHKGIRGQYITMWSSSPWMVELDFSANSDQDEMKSIESAGKAEWEALCLVEDLLKKEGTLDERYKIQEDED